MLSRVAENLFWMGRYLERADDVRRVLSVNHFLTLGSSNNLSGQWSPMLETSGDMASFLEKHTEVTREDVLLYMCLDAENANSIFSCVSMGRENARAVREQLPIEIWEAINDAYHLVQNQEGELLQADPVPFFNSLRLMQERFYGTLHTCLSQSDAWHFVNLGVQLERADKTSRILDVKYFLLLPSVYDVGGSIDTLGWEALLRSVSGLTMYRQLHKKIAAAQVVEFLLFDKYFPRSLLRCLMETENSLRMLSGESASDQERFPNIAVQRLGRMLAQLKYLDIDEVYRVGLHEYLNEMQIQLNEFGEAVHSAFFYMEQGFIAETNH
jgi:uncharacterized alpha-E superfamily protein